MIMETLTLEKKKDYVVMTLDRGKSNPMNFQMLTEIIQTLKDLKHDSVVKGLIITGKENFYSAGLDLPEIITYDREKTRDFWRGFMELISELVSFPKPLVASITGHAPAGGCIVAISCDYRVMAEGNYKIGLNEVPVGIIVPRHVYDLYAFWLGSHNAYQFLLEGKLMNPQKALEAGLVDEVVPAEMTLEAAEKKLAQYLSYNQETWRASKYNMRRNLIEKVSAYDEAMIDRVIEHWFSPKTQQILNGFVAMLKKK